jgi:hypothetical protein
MTTISQSELLALHDYKQAAGTIHTALTEACASPERLIRFMARYTAWNALFGSGVAALAGKIGRSRGIFRSRRQELLATADRGIYVASYFFDAARDEFDDRATLHRDTHRCLAQSTLQGIIDYYQQAQRIDANVGCLNDLITEPFWLRALNERVAIGYGAWSSDQVASLFRSMGYHLGSELLADQEFSVIDRTFKTQAPELTEFLKQHSVEIAGQSHRAYYWIEIHSGHGGGVEADHFKWAVKGVNKAFHYGPAELHEPLRHQVHLGFLDFVADHTEFFEFVNQDG